MTTITFENDIKIKRANLRILMTSEITLRIIFMLLNLKKFLNPKYRPRLWGK